MDAKRAALDAVQAVLDRGGSEREAEQAAIAAFLAPDATPAQLAEAARTVRLQAALDQLTPAALAAWLHDEGPDGTTSLH